MRLYYFTTAEHGLAAIRDRRLTISEITKLNDPFEFLGQSLADPKIRGRLNKIKEMVSGKSGVICFCGNWQHPMMWGHYAKSNSGICLGFDVNTPNLHKVNYVKIRNENDINYYNVTNKEQARDIIIELATTKYECWSYEEEYRIIPKLKDPDPVNELHFQPFSEKLVLKEVIVGAFSNITKLRVQRAIGDYSDDIT